MIVNIPALDFIHNLSGIYKDDQVKLSIVRCGYGVALELYDKKVIFTGVVGVLNGSIECYALVGLPNIFRFKGELISNNALRLKDEDAFLRVDIAKQQYAIIFEIYFKEKLEKSFILGRLKD